MLENRRISAGVRHMALLAYLMLLGACRIAPKEPDPTWRSVEIEAVSERILWSYALNSIQRLGYPIGTGADPTALEAKSGWRTSLAPFRGDGQRNRAELRLTRLEEQHWLVEARVAAQVNMALSDPLNPVNAKWEWLEDDTDQAEILLTMISASLGKPLDALGNKPK